MQRQTCIKLLKEFDFLNIKVEMTAQQLRPGHSCRLKGQVPDRLYAGVSPSLVDRGRRKTLRTLRRLAAAGLGEAGLLYRQRNKEGARGSADL